MPQLRLATPVGMVAMEDTPEDMEDMEDTDMARGPLRPKLMLSPDTFPEDMEAMADMVVVMEDMVVVMEAMEVMVMERGLLMPRL